MRQLLAGIVKPLGGPVDVFRRQVGDVRLTASGFPKELKEEA